MRGCTSLADAAVEEFTDLCNNLHSPNPRIQDRSYLKPAAEVKPAAQPVRPRRWTIATAVASVLLLITATYALKIYLPDGSRARLTYVQRLSVPARLLLSPAIGADGLHVFYLSNRDGGALGIWRQDVNSGKALRLAVGEFQVNDIDVSPEGKWLVFESSHRGGYFHLMPASGGAPAPLAAGGRSPRFSSDGKSITFWVADPFTASGKAFVQLLHVPAEPKPVATEYTDTHPTGVSLSAARCAPMLDKDHDL